MPPSPPPPHTHPSAQEEVVHSQSQVGIWLTAEGRGILVVVRRVRVMMTVVAGRLWGQSGTPEG